MNVKYAGKDSAPPQISRPISDCTLVKSPTIALLVIETTLNEST